MVLIDFLRFCPRYFSRGGEIKFFQIKSNRTSRNLDINLIKHFQRHKKRFLIFMIKINNSNFRIDRLFNLYKVDLWPLEIKIKHI